MTRPAVLFLTSLCCACGPGSALDAPGHVIASGDAGPAGGDGFNAPGDSTAAGGDTAAFDSVCGDALVEASEQCDDGNAADTDGCSGRCAIEAGYACSGQPSSCAPITLTAVTAGPAGPLPLGPVPAGAAADIASLVINNDRPRERTEVAYSAIPISRGFALIAVDELVVADSAGQRLQAQLIPRARWGSVATDPAAPIKWLEVAVKARVDGLGTTRYALRRITGAAPASAALDAAVVESGDRITVDTGVATFGLDRRLPGLFERIDLGGGNIFAAAAPGSGPFAIDADGVDLVARVESVRVEQGGPVKVVIAARGHFARANTGSVCDSDLAWDARLTFARGSRHVALELDLRNECGSGWSQVGPTNGEGDFWGELYRIERAGWFVPLVSPAGVETFLAVDGATTPALSGVARIEQHHGSTQNPNWRRAIASDGASVLATRDDFDRPFVGIRSSVYSAGVTLPWMRYREPQAIEARPSGLSFEIVSEPVAIGEAMTRWNFAQLRFFEADAADTAVQRERDAALDESERGLLVGTDAQYVNSTGVKPRLPERVDGARLLAYEQQIEALHQQSIDAWAIAKRYGAAWPDTHERDPANTASDTAEQSFAGSNYWSASNAELSEFYRLADPKWVWDLALPLELTFLKTTLYNVGSRDVPNDVRSGFHAGSHAANTNQRNGDLYRRGWTSDDYLYNQGSDEAFLVRPSASVLAVFEKACRTALVRYPTEAQLPAGQRDEYLSARGISRGTVQHWNMLQYAAQFSRDPVLSRQCEGRLHDIVQELLRDNLFAGIACAEDSGNDTYCETQQNFMYSALTYPFLDSYYRHFAGTPVANGVRDAVVTMADQYYVAMMPQVGTPGAIEVEGIWGKALRCTFTAGSLDGCNSPDTLYGEPSYAQERYMHLSVVLASNALAPAAGRCAAGAQALSEAYQSAFIADWIETGVGWWKGASQAMQSNVYGVGEAEWCPNP